MKAITNSELAGVNSIRRTATKDDARVSLQQSAGPAADKVKNSSDKHIDAVISGSELASKLTDLPQIVKRNLQFTVDEGTGQSVFQVIESDTGRLVRQIPSDQILHIMEQVQEAYDGKMRGMLLDDKT